MSGLVILIVVIFIAGIILLSGKSPLRKEKTREQFLQALAEFLEGALEPIEDDMHSNSFRIRFKYSGEDFVFEDFEKEGFKNKVNIAYLRVTVPDRLTLTFTEKERSTKIRTDIFIASDISSQQVEQTVQLQVPKHLNDLNVFTNDIVVANELFEIGKISSILKQFKGMDSRGYSFMPIEIIDGVVTLEFHSEKMFKPNLSVLYSNVTSIDGYLDKLMVFARELQIKP